MIACWCWEKPAGPTAENAMAAEEALARAFRNNDANAISNLLDSSWAVITANGDVAEGPKIFPKGIKSGYSDAKNVRYVRTESVKMIGPNFTLSSRLLRQRKTKTTVLR